MVKSGLFAALLLAAAASCAQAADALAPASARVSVDPNRAGAGAALGIEVTAAEPRGAYPGGIAVSLPAGSTLDGRGAPKRCSRRAALRNRCPRASRIASGVAHLLQTATFAVSDPGVPLTVAIDVYAAPTRKPRALRGLQVISREGVTQIGGFGAGGVAPVGASGGPELNFGLGLVQRAPEETITFQSLSLTLGAQRGRIPLLRNPPTCSGGWPVGIALTGIEPVTASAPCGAG